MSERKSAESRRREIVEHRAISSLLSPSLDAVLVAEFRAILQPLNAVEQGEGGLCDSSDDVLSPKAASLLERIRGYPAVRTAPHRDGPGVYRTAQEAPRASARQGERPIQD